MRSLVGPPHTAGEATDGTTTHTAGGTTTTHTAGEVTGETTTTHAQHEHLSPLQSHLSVVCVHTTRAPVPTAVTLVCCLCTNNASTCPHCSHTCLLSVYTQREHLSPLQSHCYNLCCMCTHTHKHEHLPPLQSQLSAVCVHTTRAPAPTAVTIICCLCTHSTCMLSTRVHCVRSAEGRDKTLGAVWTLSRQGSYQGETKRLATTASGKHKKDILYRQCAHYCFALFQANTKRSCFCLTTSLKKKIKNIHYSRHIPPLMIWRRLRRGEGGDGGG